MITLQEAERLLAHASHETSASDFLTTLVSAGAFRLPEALAVEEGLARRGLTYSPHVRLVMHALCDMGVVA